MNNAELPDECCGRCFYMREAPIDPNNLQRQTVCRQGPPQTNMIYTQQGSAIMCGPPPVDPVKGWCGQFKRREGTENVPDTVRPQVLT